MPTVDGLVGITSYGPSATLFTLGRNHTVQQYDLNPNARPMLVQNKQHVPANLPPSPPISDGPQDKAARYVTAGATPAQRNSDPNSSLPLYLEVENSDAEEGMIRSPLQRMAKGDDADVTDEEGEESRDQLGPLSPVSSRASSTTSRSSRGGGEKRRENSRPSSKEEYRYDGPTSPGLISNSTHSGSTATTMSMGSSSIHSSYKNRAMRESVSTRSLLSTSSSKHSSSKQSSSKQSSSKHTSSKYGKNSGLRQEVLRSPEDAKGAILVDLFPFTKSRLSDVPFRPPQYDQARCTPDDLRVQMLHVVFGWADDIEALIRDERKCSVQLMTYQTSLI